MVNKSLLSLIFFGLLSWSTHATTPSTPQEIPFTSSPASHTVEQLDEAQEILGLYDKADLERYFTIEQITVRPVESIPTYESFGLYEDKSLGQIIMVVDQLIALGQKIWPIIEAGRPVITTDFGPGVSVLPRTDQSPNDVAMYLMDAWRAPTQQTYLVEYKNAFGSTVISFKYNVSFQYNGQYQGQGRYITGLDVSANSIRVSWGFQFNATSTLVNIANRGTMEDPVASATVRINYEAKSFLSEIQASQGFHVTGEGDIQKLY